LPKNIEKTLDKRKRLCYNESSNKEAEPQGLSPSYLHAPVDIPKRHTVVVMRGVCFFDGPALFCRCRNQPYLTFGGVLQSLRKTMQKTM
jgi:hypothetical protein